LSKTILSLKDSWLLGFTDAEGCFNINIVKRKKMKTQYNISLRFILDQKDENEAILEICNLIGFGKVSCRNKKKLMLRYILHSLKISNIIIEYFNKLPLKTTKKKSFNLWRKVYFLIMYKEHLNPEGLIRIRSLRTYMNKYIIENRSIGSKKT
jgi:LAGLIDADG endonuclease